MSQCTCSISFTRFTDTLKVVNAVWHRTQCFELGMTATVSRHEKYFQFFQIIASKMSQLRIPSSSTQCIHIINGWRLLLWNYWYQHLSNHRLNTKQWANSILQTHEQTQENPLKRLANNNRLTDVFSIAIKTAQTNPINLFKWYSFNANEHMFTSSISFWFRFPLSGSFFAFYCFQSFAFFSFFSFCRHK